MTPYSWQCSLQVDFPGTAALRGRLVEQSALP